MRLLGCSRALRSSRSIGSRCGCKRSRSSFESAASRRLRVGADEEDDGETASMAPASMRGKSTAWSLNRPRPVGSLRTVAYCTPDRRQSLRMFCEPKPAEACELYEIVLFDRNNQLRHSLAIKARRSKNPAPLAKDRSSLLPPRFVLDASQDLFRVEQRREAVDRAGGRRRMAAAGLRRRLYAGR